MKKRKNIIISAITCLFSICLMMFGVYAASNPSVSISGQVSYSARDAKVLVLGKVNGQAGNDSNVDYPTVADATNPTESAVSLPAQYLGYTKGEAANDNTDNLPQWNMGTTAHAFYEDSTGIRPIVISFKMTNLSNYPVVATVDFTGVTDANLASKNLTRTTTGLKDSKVYLDKNVTKEISVTYSVANDAVGVNGDGLLNMSITFEKTVFPTPSNVKSPQGETMQSDWEYTFDGDSFTITKFVGTFPTKNSDGNSTLVIPSSFACSDGKTYPVKALGKYNNEDIFDKNVPPTVPVKIPLNDEVLAEMGILPNDDRDNFPTKIVVSNGIEKINAVAFYSTSKTDFELPDTITEIGNSAFEYTGIKQLNLLNVKSIGLWSFLSSEKLLSVTIPNVEHVGDEAFKNCGALESVTISDETDCSTSAFVNCFALRNENNKDDYGYYIGSATNKYLFMLSVIDTNITYNEKIINWKTKIIGNAAFVNCKKLSRVDIPSSVKVVGQFAFQDCSILSTVSFSKIEVIEHAAFRDCTNLQTIYIDKAEPPVLAKMAFDGCTALKTIKLTGDAQYSLELYKNAENWKDYASIIC